METTYKRLRYILFAIVFLLIGALVTRITDLRQMSQLLHRQHDWGKLELVLEQIDRHYVDSLDHQALTENLLPAILKELDPHSIYLPPARLQQADEELEGNFDGIGIMFNVPEDTAIVASVIAGGPSQRAGLLPGDRILRINGKDVAGVKFPQDSMVRRMKGPSGTRVQLDILREGTQIPYEIIRGKIPVKSLDVAYMINDTTGYIKLSKFTRTSYAEFMTAVPQLVAAGMKRLIFDLRDNTGGYFDQSLLLANEFLHRGDLIVYMEGRERPRQDFHADGRGSCQQVELAVLLDENSASSSEIFAGAIQDNDRGTLYGRRSFGKGLVQEPVNFSDGSGIRLTVARFYTPAGRCIQKPYDRGEDSYGTDLLERYRHGEMMVADSIPKNDSLMYYTVAGRPVYGGGGIIPDVFVPVDTVGVTDLLVTINRQGLQARYSLKMADKHRKALQEATTLPVLDQVLDCLNLEGSFLQYVREQGLAVDRHQWAISRDIVLTQLRAMIGRYSAMDDAAFYPLIAPLDPVIQTAVANETKVIAQ